MMGPRQLSATLDVKKSENVNTFKSEHFSLVYT